MEQGFETTIVWLILNGETEKALDALSKHYDVNAPRLKVGLPKGRKTKALGCYRAKNKTISVLNSDVLKQPFVILHEFYHHLRTNAAAEHLGTERYADDFARKFIQAYNLMNTGRAGNN